MVLLGKISKTRGNKGEVVVEISPNFDIFQIKQREPVVLKSEKYKKQGIIEQVRDINGISVFKFVGVNSITEALGLVGYSVFGNERLGNRAEKPDYSGYTVIDIKGRLWGTLIRMIITRGSTVAEISHKNDILLIPFHEEIIVTIDAESKTIIIDPPDGLMELNK